MIELEKKQRNFDKLIGEEKNNFERCLVEKENAEREAREKETKILSLNRTVDELQDALSEEEVGKKRLQVSQANKLLLVSLVEFYLPFETNFCYKT